MGARRLDQAGRRARELRSVKLPRHGRRALGRALVALDHWERAVDRFARSPRSSGALALYTLAWIVTERGNIGWDGWLTVAGVEIALGIRRWQGRAG